MSLESSEGFKSPEEAQAAREFNKEQQENPQAKFEKMPKTIQENSTVDQDLNTIEEYELAKKKFSSADKGEKGDKDREEAFNKMRDLEKRFNIENLASLAEEKFKEAEVLAKEVENLSTQAENFYNKYQGITEITDYNETMQLVSDGFSILDKLAGKYPELATKAAQAGQYEQFAIQKLGLNYMIRKDLTRSDQEYENLIKSKKDNLKELKDRFPNTSKIQQTLQKALYYGDAGVNILARIETEANWNSIFNFVFGKPQVKKGQEKLPPELFDGQQFEKIRNNVVASPEKINQAFIGGRFYYSSPGKI